MCACVVNTVKIYKHFELDAWIQCYVDKFPKHIEINNMKLNTDKWTMIHTESKKQILKCKMWKLPNHFSVKQTVDYRGCRRNIRLRIWMCFQNFGTWYWEFFISRRPLLCCSIWWEVWCQRPSSLPNTGCCFLFS